MVCLVHGHGEHVGRYSHVADALNQEGYALVAIDLRGHGRSEGKRGHVPSYEALMDDVAWLIDDAKLRFPDVPCFLYGHSMGGNLVLNFCLRRRPQLAGVIATSPWLQTAFDPPAWRLLLARVMNVLWPSLTVSNQLDFGDLSHSEDVIRAYRDDPFVHDRISARLFVSVNNAGKWAIEHASDFSLPLLLMHGSADKITSPDATVRFSRSVQGDCTFKLWDGLYHEIHNEPQKQDVLEYITNWLNARRE